MKLQNLTFTLLIIMASCFKSSATQQVADILIYDGDTLTLESILLEKYPGIDSLSKNLFGNQNACVTTGCWRGYQAEWTIENDQLYLTNIFSCCYNSDNIKANLAALFGKRFKNGKVKADWLTGEIISSKGKRLFHFADFNVFEGQSLLTFKDGSLIRVVKYDNSQSKLPEYVRDNKKLREFFNSQVAWDKIPKLEKPIRVLVQFSANELGKVDNVRLIRGYNDIIDSEAIRVTKLIPEWLVIFRLGKLFRIEWTQPIVFSEENRLPTTQP